jgi:hypothetical protein
VFNECTIVSFVMLRFKFVVFISEFFFMNSTLWKVAKLQLSHCDVTTNHPGQSYRTLHFKHLHSYIIPMAAYAVIYS